MIPSDCDCVPNTHNNKTSAREKKHSLWRHNEWRSGPWRPLSPRVPPSFRCGAPNEKSLWVIIIHSLCVLDQGIGSETCRKAIVVGRFLRIVFWNKSCMSWTHGVKEGGKVVSWRVLFLLSWSTCHVAEFDAL